MAAEISHLLEPDRQAVSVDEPDVPADAQVRRELLDDSRDFLVARLCELVSGALSSMADDLSDVAARCVRRDEQQALMDAAGVVRLHRGNLESRFRKALGECFERRLKGLPEPVAEQPLGELSLLGDDEFNGKLTVDRLVHRARGKLDSEEVLGMRARLAALVDREWFEESQSPVAPEAVYEALKRAVSELSASAKIQTALLDAFEPHVTANLNKVYSSANARLRAGHVLTKIRRRAAVTPIDPRGFGPPSANDALARAEAARAAGSGGGGAAGNVGGMGSSAGAGAGGIAPGSAAADGARGGARGGAEDLSGHGMGSGSGHGNGGAGAGSATGHHDTGFDDDCGADASAFDVNAALLRAGDAVAHGLKLPAGVDATALLNLMIQQLGNGLPTARASVAKMLTSPGSFGMADLPIPSAEAPLLDSLSNMQHAAHGFDADPAAGLHRLAEQVSDHARDQGSPLDQLTVEIVSMVFDYLYNETRLPDLIKHQLMRLQVVAVKAALIDRSFFARRQHPMRRLIDRVTELGIDPDVDLAKDSPMLGELTDLIGWILQNFDDDLHTFSEALERLEGFARSELERRAEQIAPITEQAVQRDTLDEAQRQAYGVLTQRFEESTPIFVKSFLLDDWSRVIAARTVAGDAGPADIPHVAEILQTADSLIWSVAPKIADEIPRLASVLSKLITGLNRGLATIEFAADSRKRFFDELLALHTSLIRAAKNAPVQRTAVFNATSKVRMRSDGQIQYHAPRVAQGEAQAPVAQPPDQAGVAGARSALSGQVKRGDQIELEENGQVSRYKLAWISPLQKLYVLSRAPDEARQFDVVDLAALFTSGHARVVERRSSVDSAMASVNDRASLPQSAQTPKAA